MTEAGDPVVVTSARDRRERMRRRIVQQGFVRIEDLVDEHRVSLMTVHRDLDLLQREGWLRKVRGGATAQPSPVHHGDVRHRAQAMAQRKQEIAQAALELVRPGMSVLVDESTTGLALADLLPSRGPLTVVTNFLAVVNLLAAEERVDLVALGGDYYPAYDAFLGLRTSEALSSLRADLLFMSTTAVTDAHCYHQSQETVAVKRALMAAADRRVLLLDHSKFDKRGLYQLAPLTDFDLVVVDDGTGEARLTALRELGVPLYVAPSLGADEAGAARG
ncbi:MAG: DeoR/GlpR family DNA-binding transcription regulator [Actinomycetota bacterium]|nr:DeoR/GlpR family DNA-binding transcription regulator [Actinomycetota bacterium]